MNKSDLLFILPHLFGLAALILYGESAPFKNCLGKAVELHTDTIETVFSIWVVPGYAYDGSVVEVSTNNTAFVKLELGFVGSSPNSPFHNTARPEHWTD